MVSSLRSPTKGWELCKAAKGHRPTSCCSCNQMRECPGCVQVLTHVYAHACTHTHTYPFKDSQATFDGFPNQSLLSHQLELRFTCGPSTEDVGHAHSNGHSQNPWGDEERQEGAAKAHRARA